MQVSKIPVALTISAGFATARNGHTGTCLETSAIRECGSAASVLLPSFYDHADTELPEAVPVEPE